MDSVGIRNEIISALLNANGAYVSGAELSERLKITRTAVWKHIQNLMRYGFDLETQHGSGYRLVREPDLLLEPLLRSQLPTGGTFGRHVSWHPDVASTNQIAMQLARDGATHGTLVTALAQAGGRGRRGRTWFSPAGGLWMSLILQKAIPLTRAAELTLLTSVVVRRVLVRHTGLPIDIKWPNDLLCGGKKICGILAEIRADGEHVEHAVLGIGINTNIPEDAFPEDVFARATSLLAASGKVVRHLDVAADILAELEPFYDQLVADGDGFASVCDEWRQASATLGKHIRVQTQTEILDGTAEQLDSTGVLHLRQDDGQVVRIHSGDVLF